MFFTTSACKNGIRNSLSHINAGSEFDDLDAWLELGFLLLFCRTYVEDMLRHVFSQRILNILVTGFGGDCKPVRCRVAT
jgi:hypothetical protein